MTNDAISRSVADLAPSGRLAAALPWGVLVLLLVTNGPLFLCMPIIDDAALYDLQAANVLHGGVAYRDTVEPNLPGVIWIHAAVRASLGDSSTALRVVDLCIFGFIVLLLQRVLKDLGASCLARSWTGAVCLLFYVSISEWCHCQRDMWLMVPTLAWLWLRGRQIQRMATDSSSAGRLFGWSFVEGLILGAGIWIKPMVLVPATVAWLVGGYGSRRWRLFIVDATGLGLGGLLVGVAGFVWLWCSGAWPYFWDTMLHWNPQYMAAGKTHWTLPRFAGMCLRLFPWLLLHLPALGLAAATLLRGLARRFSWGRLPAGRNPLEGDEVGGTLGPGRLAQQQTETLIAAFYVGWLVQSVALQHLFDYVHAPGVLLAILMCVASMRSRPIPAARVGLIAFVVLTLLCSPAVRCSRLRCWTQCIRHGSSAEIRDRLKLMQFPEWRDLERVAVFLRNRDVRDGEVCCLPNSTIHLYAMLDVRPPTKYVFLESCLVLFPERKEEILSALALANPKYAVTDLLTAGVPPDALSRIRPGTVVIGPSTVEGGQVRVYPWEFPILFRSGRYAVHRTDGPIRSLELMPDLPLPRARAGK